jgi:hypothetical protein
MSMAQGAQGGIGIQANAALPSAIAILASNKTLFNMLESPRGFELNSRKFSNPRADYGLPIPPSEIPYKRSGSRTRAAALCGISSLFFRWRAVV